MANVRHIGRPVFVASFFFPHSAAQPRIVSRDARGNMGGGTDVSIVSWLFGAGGFVSGCASGFTGGLAVGAGLGSALGFALGLATGGDAFFALGAARL